MNAPASSKMKAARRRPLIIACGCILMCVLVGLFWRREPRYEGRSLSNWLEPRSQIDIDARKKAIRSMGTESLPFLVRWLDTEDQGMPPWAEQLDFKLRRLPKPIGPMHLPQRLIPSRGVTSSQEKARLGFLLLGSEAAPAIPRLTELAVRRDRPVAASRAIAVLSMLREEGIPALLAVIGNPGNGNRFVAVAALSKVSSRSIYRHLVVTNMVGCLIDSDIAVVRQAARNLGIFASESDAVVPALAHQLLNPNVSLVAAEALGKFGKEAQVSVPALVEIYKSADESLREEIKRALLRIDPEAQLTLESEQGSAIGVQR